MLHMHRAEIKKTENI